MAAGLGPRRRRGRGRWAAVYIPLGPCQRPLCERLPTIRAPGRSPPRLRPPGPAGVGEANRGEGRAGPEACVWVCCLGFLGTRLDLCRPLPQGFVLTGNVLLEGRGCGRTWAGVGGADSCASPRRYPQGKEAGGASQAQIQPLASQGWLVFSKAAPLGGTTGVNSADLRWHVDEQGYVFSLVLGKASIKREISQ